MSIAINPDLARRVREADVLFAIGARLDEITTECYTTVQAPQPRQRLVHVRPGAEELGRVCRPELAILSEPAELLKVLHHTRLRRTS